MLPLEERPAWLAALPPQFELLREPLRRLLEVQAGVQTRPFLDAFTSGIEGLTPPATVIVGDLVGPYRLLQQLGDGGMGSVWLAERADGTLKRRVALKLPRMVWARDLSVRMARERDILGSLEHPNIARLYDAGVDQLGRPFLALEYVEGQRIDEYCDENRLSISARIRLFLQVLDAVDYAHVNLVLHRDLKPGNVLVNQRGEVRLLDFGIAKLMSDEESLTPIDQNSRTSARAMTPRYASPEQIQHLRLTLASDVYSLGVMLYELLVGASPLITQKASRAEIETAIIEGHLKTPSRAKIEASTAEKRATTPSRISRVLRGDLDAVLLKALARNTTDRYPAVEALRADLVRWLEERPVLAKPPSRFSIVKKFVARNTLAVSLGSAATCAVLTATIIAILQAHEAKIESRRAAATRDFLIGLFENANPELHGGRDVSVQEILIAGGERLSGDFEAEPEIAAEIALSIGNAWARLGNYEQQAKLSAIRSRILSQIPESPGYAEALISEAQLASHFSDIESVRQSLLKIELLGDIARLPLPIQSDYYWLSAWYAKSNEEPLQAIELFEQAEKIAHQGKDGSREIGAIYGLMSAQFASGDWPNALMSFHRAVRALERSSISEGERIRRSLELHGALFEAGAYDAGWSTLKALIGRVEENFGGVSVVSERLYVLAANWAIRVGELRTAREFLNRLREYQSTTRPRSGKYFEWDLALIEARLALASGDYPTTSTIARRNFSDATEKNHRFSMALLLAEALIREGDPIGALKILASDDWSSLALKSESESSEDQIFLLWVRGVALEKIGDSNGAIEALREAKRLSLYKFKYWHPITATVTNALILSELRSSRKIVAREALLKDAERATSVLKRAYPHGHSTLEAASVILSMLGTSESDIDKETLVRLSKEAPFL